MFDGRLAGLYHQAEASRLHGEALRLQNCIKALASDNVYGRGGVKHTRHDHDDDDDEVVSDRIANVEFLEALYPVWSLQHGEDYGRKDVHQFSHHPNRQRVWAVSSLPFLQRRGRRSISVLLDNIES